MTNRLYPLQPLVGASVAIFKDGKVLLAARKETVDHPIFSLPGGLVEIGETLEEAAMREAIEEVGVTARIVGFAGHVEIIDHDKERRVRQHFIVNAFAAEWISGEAITSYEAPGVMWVDPFALGPIAVTKGLPNLVRKAAELVFSRVSVPR
jgi:ADP-ribose pyrophosphatase YjhB (NUDIX family)